MIFSESAFENNGIVTLDIFLDYGDVCNYLQSKFWTWKTVTIFFELQMSQTLSNPIWKAITTFY